MLCVNVYFEVICGMVYCFGLCGDVYFLLCYVFLGSVVFVRVKRLFID